MLPAANSKQNLMFPFEKITSSVSHLHGRRGLVETRSAARGPQKKNARGLQRKLGKREVGKPGIECIRKLSYHVVDWFLVSPGLTLRGSRSSYDSRTGGFFFFAFSIWEHPAVLGPPPEPGTEEAGSSIFFLVISVHLPVT